MSASRVFIARLAGCGVFDPAGDRVGKVIDVLVAYRKSGSPKATGMLVEISGRRKVFVPIARVTSISAGQVITTGLIDLRRFTQHGQELRVIAQMLGRKVRLLDGTGSANIEDLAIEQGKNKEWTVSELFLRRPKTSASPFARGATVFASWEQISEEHEGDEGQTAQQLIATYSELRPADLASALLDLPDERMLEVAEELDDERLADVLEELPEEEQIDIIAELDDERAAEVLDLMEPDDAADLMANLPEERSEAILDLMDEEEAEDIRMLMQFDEFTAGGLMTTEPIICAADATVAEAMAMIRKKEVSPVLAASVFVTLPPYETATGRYLGTVHFQKMLRYPPHERLSVLLDVELEPVKADTHISVIHRTFANYNLVALPVVDDEHRLIGVVTVDDVLDHLLPDDWRTEEEVH
ncbi:magnesium transporter MgtE N-terminal domain-containing protein [Rhodoluna lacicola]|uniref:Mg/Co/Ni transporter MgtE (Contains CBS domain) n=1 Tax=Rhodoluna lacicola TaxID=529884 RepID=A0A060JF89_9MICO|nr:CBS domain-containing protein [Rhodoluna lacicola]AIC47202.1 Mg/Co/Ni transporter MgtE (contains CBS domain) [Rhodoluna lacicola]BDS50098.1 magnesium transporter [Rhodoluna lacicola]